MLLVGRAGGGVFFGEAGASQEAESRPGMEFDIGTDFRHLFAVLYFCRFGVRMQWLVTLRRWAKVRSCTW